MNDQDYIVFEAYLSGELSKEELSAFELKLKEDSDFKQSFDTYKELTGFLEHEIGNEASKQEFQDNLKTISESYFKGEKQTKTRGVFKLYKYAIAACVALLIGFFAYNQFSTPTYSDFANYQTISLTVRSGDAELLAKAETAFNSKQYTEAEQLFNEILQNDPSNLEVQLYKSVSLIEINQFTEVDALLENISETNSAYKNKATWYLALSKLKQKDFESCAKILKTIPEDAEDYKQAQKLLKKLD